jgi:hypothetical protein
MILVFFQNLGRVQHNGLGFGESNQIPISREMPLIACNQVVRARRNGAFEKHIVIGVRRDFKSAGGRHDMAVILDEL